MKTLLTGVALAFASVAAFAQSSVTIFGIVDAAVSRYSVESVYVGAANSALGPQTPPRIRVEQTALNASGYNASRLGFRGTENLGGGLAAGFWLEAALANDTGARGLDNFLRRSIVTLAGPYGELRLGRDYTPTFLNDLAFDPFGITGVGASLFFAEGNNLAIARGPGSPGNPTDNYVRTSNSVGYVLPAGLGGVYGQLQYALHENVDTQGLPGSPSTRGRFYGGRIGIAKGPMDVALAYGASTAADVALPGGLRDVETIRTTNLAASYDFDVLKLFGELSQVKDRRDSYDGGLVGVTIPIGPGLVKLAHSRLKYHADATGLETSTSKWALGYVHNLSRRTALYATAARIRIHGGQNNPGVMGTTTGGGPAFPSAASGMPGYAPRSATGFDLGVRHAF